MALDKKIKKAIYAKPHDLMVEPPPGFLNLCKGEVEEVFSSLVQKYKFTPKFTESKDYVSISDVDFRLFYELSLRLLTARDILWVLSTKHVGSIKELIKALAKVDYSLIIPKGSKVSIKVRSFRSILYHENMISQHVSESLEEFGYKVDKEGETDFNLVFIMQNNRLTVAISLSGQPLYYRGYKAEFKTIAPLPEHVAQSLNRYCIEWTQKKGIDTSLLEDKPLHLFNPFTGSGGLGFEAVSLLLHAPINKWGRKFAFEKFVCHTDASYANLCKRLDEKLKAKVSELQSRGLFLSMVDTSEKQIAEIEKNSEKFLKAFSPSEKFLKTEIYNEDLFDLDVDKTIKSDEALWIMMNPPFGLRLSTGPGSVNSFYKRLSQYIDEVLSKREGVSFGYCLIPNEDAFFTFKSNLKNEQIQFETKHFTLGGRDIRAFYFLKR